MELWRIYQGGCHMDARLASDPATAIEHLFATTLDIQALSEEAYISAYSHAELAPSARDALSLVVALDSVNWPEKPSNLIPLHVCKCSLLFSVLPSLSVVHLLVVCLDLVVLLEGSALRYGLASIAYLHRQTASLPCVHVPMRHDMIQFS
jgi:hypothetical protein